MSCMRSFFFIASLLSCAPFVLELLNAKGQVVQMHMPISCDIWLLQNAGPVS